MISPEELVLRLVVAAILGGLVSLERERLEWAAGMRTHALVWLGCALFMVASIFGFSDISLLFTGFAWGCSEGTQKMRFKRLRRSSTMRSHV
jgi:uncharacterized membrane protein YhiD involved in acid resistance